MTAWFFVTIYISAWNGQPSVTTHGPYMTQQACATVQKIMPVDSQNRKSNCYKAKVIKEDHK